MTLMTPRGLTALFTLSAVLLSSPLRAETPDAVKDDKAVASIPRADSKEVGHWLGWVLNEKKLPIQVEMSLDSYHCFVWLPKSSGEKTQVGYYTNNKDVITLVKNDKSVVARFKLTGKDKRELVQLDAKAPAVTDKTDEKAVRAAEDCCRLIKL